MQGVRKCILPGFLRLFGTLKWGVIEKIFLIFSQKIYYNNQNLCKQPEKGLLKIPLKTASFQRLYFTFNFKIRNVAYMLHFYFLQKKSTTTLLAVLSKHDYYS